MSSRLLSKCQVIAQRSPKQKNKCVHDDDDRERWRMQTDMNRILMTTLPKIRSTRYH